MESALRPRDIQARIRAGESPEAVAAVAQMPMERVMAFAGPVLAERDHIASLAQRASVRRRGGADAPARNLGAWVTERLRTRQVDPASAEWDAWRREDGRWAVRVSYFVEADDEAEQKDEKIAMFAYDAPGRYAVPDDDEARWLVGEQAQVQAPADPAHASAGRAPADRGRRHRPVRCSRSRCRQLRGRLRGHRQPPPPEPPGFPRADARPGAWSAPGPLGPEPGRRADADRRTDRSAAGAAAVGARRRAFGATPGRDRDVRTPGGARRCAREPLHRTPSPPDRGPAPVRQAPESRGPAERPAPDSRTVERPDAAPADRRSAAPPSRRSRPWTQPLSRRFRSPIRRRRPHRPSRPPRKKLPSPRRSRPAAPRSGPASRAGTRSCSARKPTDPHSFGLPSTSATPSRRPRVSAIPPVSTGRRCG